MSHRLKYVSFTYLWKYQLETFLTSETFSDTGKDKNMPPFLQFPLPTIQTGQTLLRQRINKDINKTVSWILKYSHLSALAHIKTSIHQYKYKSRDKALILTSHRPMSKEEKEIGSASTSQQLGSKSCQRGLIQGNKVPDMPVEGWPQKPNRQHRQLEWQSAKQLMRLKIIYTF